MLHPQNETPNHDRPAWEWECSGFCHLSPLATASPAPRPRCGGGLAGLHPRHPAHRRDGSTGSQTLKSKELRGRKASREVNGTSRLSHPTSSRTGWSGAAPTPAAGLPRPSPPETPTHLRGRHPGAGCEPAGLPAMGAGGRELRQQPSRAGLGWAGLGRGAAPRRRGTRSSAPAAAPQRPGTVRPGGGGRRGGAGAAALLPPARPAAPPGLQPRFHLTRDKTSQRRGKTPGGVKPCFTPAPSRPHNHRACFIQQQCHPLPKTPPVSEPHQHPSGHI